MVFVSVLLLVVVGAIIYGLYKGQTAKKIEADLKGWLGDAIKARDAAEGDVRTHYDATVTKIRTFLVDHFTL